MGRELKVKYVEHRKKGWRAQYPLHEMLPGDWFICPKLSLQGLRSSVYAHGRRIPGRRFSVIDLGNDTVKCLMVEPEADLSRGTFHINVFQTVELDDPRINEKCVYPFEYMRAGDWFALPASHRQKVQHAAYRYNKAMKDTGDLKRICLREGLGHNVQLGLVKVTCYAKGCTPKSNTVENRRSRYAML